MGDFLGTFVLLIGIASIVIISIAGITIALMRLFLDVLGWGEMTSGIATLLIEMVLNTLFLTFVMLEYLG